jgi:hypothetical protein
MILKQIYSDDPLLPEFMDACAAKGYNNNSSLKAMKFDHFEYSAFFAVIQNNKIKSVSGIHNFEYENQKYYRIGFRSVALYDQEFKFKPSKDLLKTSIQYGLMFPIQIIYAQKTFPKAPFVLTTNNSLNEYDNAGKSKIIDKKFRQSLHRLRGISILNENIYYLNTYQTLWSIDETFFLSIYAENKKNFNMEIIL